MAQVRLDRGAIRRAVRGASMSELRRVGPMVTNRMKILAPVDTGRLRNAIGPPRYTRTWTLRPQVVIDINVDYAAYVNDGTAPHLIRPRTQGGVLRFRIGNRIVYARVVHHPGTRPQPFADRAVQEICGPRGYRVTNG